MPFIDPVGSSYIMYGTIDLFLCVSVRGLKGVCVQHCCGNLSESLAAVSLNYLISAVSCYMSICSSRNVFSIREHKGRDTQGYPGSTETEKDIGFRRQLNLQKAI